MDTWIFSFLFLRPVFPYNFETAYKRSNDPIVLKFGTLVDWGSLGKSKMTQSC